MKMKIKINASNQVILGETVLATLKTREEAESVRAVIIKANNDCVALDGKGKLADAV